MPFPTIPRDKLLHFLGGAILQTVFCLFGLPYVKGLGAVALIAGAKEIYDRFHPAKHTADIWDFFATVLGGALAAAFFFALTTSGAL